MASVSIGQSKCKTGVRLSCQLSKSEWETLKLCLLTFLRFDFTVHTKATDKNIVKNVSKTLSSDNATVRNTKFSIQFHFNVVY